MVVFPICKIMKRLYLDVCICGSSVDELFVCHSYDYAYYELLLLFLL